MADDPQEPRGLGWGYIVYQQIAGVVGAFALIAFLAHLIDLDWRGAVRSLVSVWDTVVRPTVSLILEKTGLADFVFRTATFLNLPVDPVKDYLALGLVMFGGSFQAARAQALREGISLRGFIANLITRYPLRVIVMFLVSLLAWPVIVVSVLFSITTSVQVRLFGVLFEQRRWRETVYMLSALTWLLLLGFSSVHV